MSASGWAGPRGRIRSDEHVTAIRTFAAAQARVHLRGGIVWDSEPEEELEESRVKARPSLEAVGSPVTA